MWCSTGHINHRNSDSQLRRVARAEPSQTSTVGQMWGDCRHGRRDTCKETWMVTRLCILTQKPIKICLVFAGSRARKSTGRGGEEATEKTQTEEDTGDVTRSGNSIKVTGLSTVSGLSVPTHLPTDLQSISRSVAAITIGKASHTKNCSVASCPTAWQISPKCVAHTCERQRPTHHFFFFLFVLTNCKA